MTQLGAVGGRTVYETLGIVHVGPGPARGAKRTRATNADRAWVKQKWVGTAGITKGTDYPKLRLVLEETEERYTAELVGDLTVD